MIKKEVFQHAGDEYLGYEYYRITIDYEQYFLDIHIYPITLQLSFINKKLIQLTLKLFSFGIFIGGHNG